jgi:MFS transporter, ACS family, D-galactonate transporter
VAESSNPPSAVRFAVLAWFCLAAIVVYLQRVSIGVIEQTIRGEFDVSKTAMATVMSGYYWAYAFGQLPAGWLAQRFGTRVMLPLCVAMSSVCCGAMMWARSLDELRFAWTLAGLSVAGVFPCCVQSIVRWFPPDQRAFPSGSLGSSMSIGGAISTALTGWLVLQSFSSDLAGWRLVFAVYAIPGLIWAMTFPLWFRERPVHETVVAASSESPEDVVREPEWWTDYRTWLICAQQFLRAAGYVFYATWFPTFLKETRGVTTEQAGWLTSLPLLGVVAGGALGGFIIDAIDRHTRSRRISRQLVAVSCHGLCGLLVFAAAGIDDARMAVSVIAIGSFAFAIGGACSYTITMDLGGSRAAMLFAVMNTCGNVGAAACPEVVAWLLKYVEWNAILYYFGGLYLGVAACWACLDPTPRKADLKSPI